MTSNIGSIYLLEGIKSDGTIDELARDKVMDEMRRTFRPEFLNRIDEIVMFKPLLKDEIFKIIDIQVEEIQLRLEDRQIQIDFTEEAKDFVLNKAYSIQYGARPVKRFLQKELETKIGRAIISGELKDKDLIQIIVQNDDLKLKIISN